MILSNLLSYRKLSYRKVCSNLCSSKYNFLIELDAYALPADIGYDPILDLKDGLQEIRKGMG